MNRNGVSKSNAKRVGRQSLQVDIKAVASLRTVGEKEAFYFYEAVGRPTGHVARNLSEFLDNVQTVKAESLEFHLQRSDFQNWAKNTLGDSMLAEELSRISSSSKGNIRTNLCNTVKNHMRELTLSSHEVSIMNSETGIPIRV